MRSIFETFRASKLVAVTLALLWVAGFALFLHSSHPAYVGRFSLTVGKIPALDGRGDAAEFVEPPSRISLRVRSSEYLSALCRRPGVQCGPGNVTDDTVKVDADPISEGSRSTDTILATVRLGAPDAVKRLVAAIISDITQTHQRRFDEEQAQVRRLITFDEGLLAAGKLSDFEQSEVAEKMFRYRHLLDLYPSSMTVGTMISGVHRVGPTARAAIVIFLVTYFCAFFGYTIVFKG